MGSTVELNECRAASQIGGLAFAIRQAAVACGDPVLGADEYVSGSLAASDEGVGSGDPHPAELGIVLRLEAHHRRIVTLRNGAIKTIAVLADVAPVGLRKRNFNDQRCGRRIKDLDAVPERFVHAPGSTNGGPAALVGKRDSRWWIRAASVVKVSAG